MVPPPASLGKADRGGPITRSHNQKPYARPSSLHTKEPLPHSQSHTGTPQKSTIGPYHQPSTPNSASRSGNGSAASTSFFGKFRNWLSSGAGAQTPTRDQNRDGDGGDGEQDSPMGGELGEYGRTGTPKRDRSSSPEGEAESSYQQHQYARSTKRRKGASPTKSILNGESKSGHIEFAQGRDRGVVRRMDYAAERERDRSGFVKPLARSSTVSGYNDPPLSMLARSVTERNLGRSMSGSVKGSGGGMKRSGTMSGLSGLPSSGLAKKSNLNPNSNTPGSSKGPAPWSPWDKKLSSGGDGDGGMDQDMEVEMKEQAEALMRARQGSVARGSPMRESPFRARGPSVLGSQGRNAYGPASASPFQPSPRSTTNFRRSQSILSFNNEPSGFSSFGNNPGRRQHSQMHADDSMDEDMRSPTKGRSGAGGSRISVTPGRMSVDPPMGSGMRGRSRVQSMHMRDDSMDGAEQQQEDDDGAEKGNEADLIMQTLIQLRDPKAGRRSSPIVGNGMDNIGSGSGSGSMGLPKSFSSRTLRREILVPKPSPIGTDSAESSGSSSKFKALMVKSASERDLKRSASSKSVTGGKSTPGRAIGGPGSGRYISATTPSEEPASRAESPRLERSKAGFLSPQADPNTFGQPSASTSTPVPLPVQFSPSAKKVTPSASNHVSTLRSKTTRPNAQSNKRQPAPSVSKAAVRPGSRFSALDIDFEDDEEGDAASSSAANVQGSGTGQASSSENQASTDSTKAGTSSFLAPGTPKGKGTYAPRQPSPLKIVASAGSSGSPPAKLDAAPAGTQASNFFNQAAATAASQNQAGSVQAGQPPLFGFGSSNLASASGTAGTPPSYMLKTTAASPGIDIANSSSKSFDNAASMPGPIASSTPGAFAAPAGSGSLFKPGPIADVPQPPTEPINFMDAIRAAQAKEQQTQQVDPSPAPAPASAPPPPASNPFAGLLGNNNISNNTNTGTASLATASSAVPTTSAGFGDVATSSLGATMGGAAAGSTSLFGGFGSSAAPMSAPTTTPNPTPIFAGLSSLPTTGSGFGSAAPQSQNPQQQAPAANPFAAPKSEANTAEPKAAFTFGQPAASASASGSSTPTAAPSGSFSFGAPGANYATTTGSASIPQGFGSGAAAAPFGFGSGNASASTGTGTGNPLFGGIQTLGQTATPTTASGPGPVQFGGFSGNAVIPNAAGSSTAFNFGSSSTPTATSGGNVAFQFGAPASNNNGGGPSNTTFGFGGTGTGMNTPPINPVQSGFNFGSPAQPSPGVNPFSNPTGFGAGGGGAQSPALDDSSRARTGSPAGGGMFNIGSAGDAGGPPGMRSGSPGPGGRTIRGMPGQRKRR